MPGDFDFLGLGGGCRDRAGKDEPGKEGHERTHRGKLLRGNGRTRGKNGDRTRDYRGPVPVFTTGHYFIISDDRGPRQEHPQNGRKKRGQDSWFNEPYPRTSRLKVHSRNRRISSWPLSKTRGLAAATISS